ncbi:MAG: hypothetical protein KIS77_02310 [Saprospiraceae bacterium]|nr:hypothetical protein [Saprospiraceae bacterium]
MKKNGPVGGGIANRKVGAWEAKIKRQKSGYQHSGQKTAQRVLVKIIRTIGRKTKCNSIFAAPQAMKTSH